MVVNVKKLRIEGLKSSYGKKKVLKDVSFEAEEGDAIALVGPNGCGKSTLLRILAGLQKPDKGVVTFADEKISSASVGYVPQESNLVPELTVKDNLLLWYQDRNALAKELQSGFLHMFEIDKMLSLRAGKLSGGMKKRVMIGCALAGNPSVLLLDEPNAALDLPGKAEIRKFLSHYMEKSGIVILATHDESDLELCQKVICLHGGESKEIDRTLRGEELVQTILQETC